MIRSRTHYLCFIFHPGEILWSADPDVTMPHFNFYQGQVVPDLDSDGVPDYVITHGGDTRFSDTVSYFFTEFGDFYLHVFICTYKVKKSEASLRLTDPPDTV